MRERGLSRGRREKGGEEDKDEEGGISDNAGGRDAGMAIRRLLEMDIKPSMIMTEAAFRNAMVEEDDDDDDDDDEEEEEEREG
eukprot:768628-Hanusia_phi.AAC.10